MKQLTLIFSFFVLCLTTLNTALASPYKLSLNNEILYLSTGGAMGLLGLWNEKDRKGPSEYTLSTLNKNDIPSIDRHYAGKWNKNFQTISDVMLIASLATPFALGLKQQNDLTTLGTMYAETLVLTAGGMSLAKGSITRFRPFTYDDQAALNDRTDKDANRSFFSGHAALIAASMTFTATTYSDYHSESKYKHHVWGLAIASTLLGGWSRVEGGKHFPSDVLAGWVWGGLIGYSIPALHRQKSMQKLMPYVTTKHFGLSFFHKF